MVCSSQYLKKDPLMSSFFCVSIMKLLQCVSSQWHELITIEFSPMKRTQSSAMKFIALEHHPLFTWRLPTINLLYALLLNMILLHTCACWLTGCVNAWRVKSNYLIMKLIISKKILYLYMKSERRFHCLSHFHWNLCSVCGASHAMNSRW